tara:strand:+ start:981 stop:1475 length:495 start_codon:yes stop_codon:yes gene_type:complete
MSQTNLCEHLVKNIDNTQENRDYVRAVNKIAKNSKSRWRLKIRYRKPKEGKTYGYGGSVRQEDANAFSIYLDDKTPWHETNWSKLRNEYSILERENEDLKKRIAILENPYMQWSLGDIETELFELREDIVDRFIDKVEDEELRNNYNLLVEAQVLKEGESNENK